jgi:hypothetical protein
MVEAVEGTESEQRPWTFSVDAPLVLGAHFIIRFQA